MILDADAQATRTFAPYRLSDGIVQPGSVRGFMASSETLNSIRSTVASLFNVPVEEVSADSSPKTIEAWDSMGQLTLILEFEQEFGIEITHARAQRMESVGAIADMIDEALAA